MGEGLNMKKQRPEGSMGWTFETNVAATVSSSFLFRGYLTLQGLMIVQTVHLVTLTLATLVSMV